VTRAATIETVKTKIRRKREVILFISFSA